MCHFFQTERDDVQSESTEGTEGNEDRDDAQNECTDGFDPVVKAVEGNAKDDAETTGQRPSFQLSLQQRCVRQTSTSLTQVQHFRLDTGSSPGRSENDEHEEDMIPNITSFADQVLHQPSGLSVEHCSTVSLPCISPAWSPRKKTTGSPRPPRTPQSDAGFHSGFVGTSLSSSSACRNSPSSCDTFSNLLSPSPSSLLTLSPNSPGTNITRPATSIQHEWYRSRIEKIYQDCNPSKLAHLDHLLKKKAGAEHRAYLRICKKYGVSPDEFPGSVLLPVAEETNPCGLSVKPAGGELDFITVGALVYGLDSGIVPVRKAHEFKVHVSGAEFNTAANLADCFRLHTGICTAMVQYPIGDLIHERVRAMGVRTFYKYFEHDGVTGPNMAMVFSNRGQGLRAPVVFYNRSNEAAQKLKKGDFNWPNIFISTGTRWFHSGGLFVVLAPSLPELVVDAFHEAKRADLVTSYELDYQEKLWNSQGGLKRCQEVNNSIVANVDVLLASVKDMQLGLGISEQDVEKWSEFDPSVFSAMVGKVVDRHPNVKVVATTRRHTHSTNRYSWSAVCWAKGSTYSIAPTIELDVCDRVGGSDGFASGFASGFIYGILKHLDPEACLKMGWAHGALMMTYPGDATMATLAEVELLAANIPR